MSIEGYLFLLIAVIAGVVIAAVTASRRDKRAAATAVPQPHPTPAERVPAQTAPEGTANRERVSSFIGAGCLIQGLGLLAPFILYVVFAAVGGSMAGAVGGLTAEALGGFTAGAVGGLIGLVLLVILFFVGSQKSQSWRCGNCKNPIASRAVRLCPACRATFR